MNKLILAIFFMISISCKAQNVTLNEVKGKELNQFIGGIYYYEKFELKNNYIRTFVTFSSSQKDGLDDGSVTNDIYISNCETGELIDCKLYIIENLINIKVENVIEDDQNIIVQISSGNFKERIFTIIKVSKN